MYFTYILVNPQGNLYKGITNNLKRRLLQHNRNYSPGTKNKGPWKLIYYEQFESRVDARKREVYFKSGIGRKFIKNYMLKLDSVLGR